MHRSNRSAVIWRLLLSSTLGSLAAGACSGSGGGGTGSSTGGSDGTDSGGSTSGGATCGNGVQDGLESDVDCGGPECPACGAGEGCVINGDCASQACVGGVCGDPSCSDGSQNQDETGVDCGGSCGPCGTGEGCTSNAGCLSGKCVEDVCEAPTCDDAIQNGTESDVDCGGLTCDGCADGGTCTGNDDCASGYCLDGACAAKQCDTDAECSDLTTACAEGLCDVATFTCMAMPIVDCSDMDGPCVMGVCNPADGTCGTEAINEGDPCDDGDACTADDACLAGVCTDASGPDVYINEAFADNAAGWALGTNWEIGPTLQSPAGGAGTGMDPAEDHTATADNGVAGVLLGGLTSGSQQFTYLESPSVDVQGVNGDLTFSFWRWLNSDVSSKMTSVIEVRDGNGWTLLWENDANTVVADDAWMLQELDVTAYKNADFRIRIGYKATGAAADTAGWNVDDVLLAPPGCDP